MRSGTEEISKVGTLFCRQQRFLEGCELPPVKVRFPRHHEVETNRLVIRISW